MNADASPSVDRARRAAVHQALSDELRLAVVDALRETDLTPGDLAGRLDVGTNLLAHHLDVLEEAGVVARRRSDGDGRRRYVRLVVDDPFASAPLAGARGHVLFVCTRNAARSQLAAALWVDRGGSASCAGADPARRIDADAVLVARRAGLRMTTPRPRGYDDVAERVDLVVSVCDRAHEAVPPFDAPSLHWSVPDPAGGPVEAYVAARDELRRRIDRIAAAPLA